MAGGVDIKSSHDMGYFIELQIVKGELKKAKEQIKELERELEKYTGPKPHWDRWDYKEWNRRNKK